LGSRIVNGHELQLILSQPSESIATANNEPQIVALPSSDFNDRIELKQ
jgi:hypothetical protein